MDEVSTRERAIQALEEARGSVRDLSLEAYTNDAERAILNVVAQLDAATRLVAGLCLICGRIPDEDGSCPCSAWDGDVGGPEDPWPNDCPTCAAEPAGDDPDARCPDCGRMIGEPEA